MGIVTVSIDDDVEEKLRERIGDRKGELGETISKAIENWIDEEESDELRERALKRLEEGYNMGEKLYEDRSDIHDRWEENSD